MIIRELRFDNRHRLAPHLTKPVFAPSLNSRNYSWFSIVRMNWLKLPTDKIYDHQLWYSSWMYNVICLTHKFIDNSNMIQMFSTILWFCSGFGRFGVDLFWTRGTRRQEHFLEQNYLFFSFLIFYEMLFILSVVDHHRINSHFNLKRMRRKLANRCVSAFFNSLPSLVLSY